LAKIRLCAGRDSANIRNMEQMDPALEQARQAGIDLDLLDCNLALTVEQRWKQHDAALALALKLEAAGKIRDARLQSVASASR
jgi:pheromone shutdown protein TraB